MILVYSSKYNKNRVIGSEEYNRNNIYNDNSRPLYAYMIFSKNKICC